MRRVFLAVWIALVSLDAHAQRERDTSPCSGLINPALWTECSGTVQLSNGGTFTGEFQSGRFYEGVYKYPSGATFEGHFGDRGGTFSNSSQIKGSDGVYARAGKLLLVNGEVYFGNISAGKLDGLGVYKYSNGTVFLGDFSRGNRHGKGILYNANGEVILSGDWRDDEFVSTRVLESSRYGIESFASRFAGRPSIRSEITELTTTKNEGQAGLGRVSTDLVTAEKQRLAHDVQDVKAERERLAKELEAAKQKRLALQAQAEMAERDHIAAELQAERRQTKEAEVRLLDTRKRVASLGAAGQPPRQPVPVSNSRRVALVIGNSAYTNAPRLTNPSSDAAMISAALRDAGFQSVTVETDLSQQATLKALRDFASQADSADWAVVYYAGHGIEFGGVNYLIPTDALLKADRDVNLEGVDLGKVMAAVEGAKRLRLVILDACRDNPFANQMRRTMTSRSIGRGLGKVEPEPGTLVAYAAKHGETASDGTGENSPFAEALAKRIKQTPPIEVRRLFDYVRDDVLESTNKKQQPFSYGSVSATEDFFFVQPK
jgi:hypothetical protein